MIVFTLQCSKGHSFDEWFKSSDEYDELSAKGEIECPECGDKEVSKGLMAPAVKSAYSSEPAPAPSCETGGCATGACPWAAE